MTVINVARFTLFNQQSILYCTHSIQNKASTTHTKMVFIPVVVLTLLVAGILLVLFYLVIPGGIILYTENATLVRPIFDRTKEAVGKYW